MIMQLMPNVSDGRPPPVCKNLKKRFWRLGRVFEAMKKVFGDLEKFSRRGKTFLEAWKSFRSDEKRFWELGKVFGTLRNIFEIIIFTT